MEHLAVASISVKVMAPARPMTRSGGGEALRHVVYVLEHAESADFLLPLHPLRALRRGIFIVLA